MRRDGVSRRFLATAIALVLTGVTCARKEEPRTEGAPAAPSALPSPPPGVSALPESAFRVRWGKADIPARMAAGSTHPVTVTFRNAGDRTWPDAAATAATGSAAYAVRLSYRWWHRDAAEPLTSFEAVNRVELGKPVPPGESATVTFEVKAPTEKGPLKLQIDLVQELVAWFGAAGADPLFLPVTIE